MCVLALAWQAHPGWRLVLAANRDERHDRASAPLARWTDAPTVLGGRDLVSGGTWLGVSDEGRLAVVTNLHTGAPPDPQAPSRGQLLKDLLTRTDPALALCSDALATFNPFSLIFITGGEATFASNRPEAITHPLAPGVHGLSNAALNAPWPKTERLKAAVSDWLAQDSDERETLLDALADDRTAGDARVPAQSSIFIRNPIFGTRCSTVVTIDDAGQGTIVERRFRPDGTPDGQTTARFTWPAASVL